jgi:hypothetical protein
MSVRTIPVDSWSSFLESFTRQHHGWLVTISRGDERLADDEPLDFARAADRSVVVGAGGRQHRLENVREIAVTASGEDESAIGHVDISNGRETMTLRFRAVISPELVDGVMP